MNIKTIKKLLYFLLFFFTQLSCQLLSKESTTDIDSQVNECAYSSAIYKHLRDRSKCWDMINKLGASNNQPKYTDCFYANQRELVNLGYFEVGYYLVKNNGIKNRLNQMFKELNSFFYEDIDNGYFLLPSDEDGVLKIWYNDRIKKRVFEFVDEYSLRPLNREEAKQIDPHTVE